LWLFFIDLILGFTFGTLCIIYHNEALSLIHTLYDFLNENILKSQIDWLMGWPAGFKLNEDLDRFLGTVFLFYIDRWIG
jgi:phosphatidylinositol glycan class Q protein